MLDKIPNAEEMTALVGQSLYSVWNELCALIDEKYEMECLWNKGGKAWNYEYKYRRGGKTLCALYAKENCVGFMIILGKDERLKFDTDRDNYFGGAWTSVSNGYYLKAVSGNAGTYNSAGIPNIEGNLYIRNSTASTGLGTQSSADGAFSLAQLDSSKHKTFGDSNSSYQVKYVHFNANSGSSTKGIYGNSNTVTPLNYGVYMWIRTA